MPLSVNVGLSRKASKDYQSTGVSINLTAELDQSLLARPEELQHQVDELYAQAEIALTKHACEPQARNQVQQRRQASNSRTHEQSNGNGPGGQHQPSSNVKQGNGRGNASMTDSQRRAITAIARRINVDAAQECRDIIGPELEQLNISQASELIDHLKSLQQQAGNGSGGGR